MLRELEIIKNISINKDIFILSLKNEFYIKGLPGQFAMIRVSNSYDPLLLRPFSFYKISQDTIEFLYQVRGKGTYLLSKKRGGDRLKILAPLGTSFPLPEKNEKITIIGGGMGIAPLSFLLDLLPPEDVKIHSFIGFPTKFSKKLWEKFEERSDYFLITTEDGSMGEKGKVLDFIENLEESNRIYACGPISMLKELWRRVEDKSKLYISLEEKMGCGIGICLGCIFPGREKNLHICKDGPVVSGVEVSFE